MAEEIRPGHTYVRDTPFDRLRLLQRGAAANVDVVCCRRLVDFPNQTAPATATVERCASCGQAICVAPTSPANVTRICLQCHGVEPLPFTGPVVDEAGRPQ